MSSRNSSLRTADRATHIRIVVVALVAAVVVVTVGLNVRAPDTATVTATKARDRWSGAKGGAAYGLLHQRRLRSSLNCGG